MWFATVLGGVSRHDGVTWSLLDTRDGLAGDYIRSIHEDAGGTIWFATTRGVTRYRPSTSMPKVRITTIRIGGEYIDPEAIPPSANISRENLTTTWGQIKRRNSRRKSKYRKLV